MLKILSSDEFKNCKRENLLDYRGYTEQAEDLTMRIPRTTQRMADKDWMSKKTDSEAKNMAHGRSRHAANLLTLSYSAGATVDDLAAAYPVTISYWGEYAAFHKAYVSSDEHQGSWVAHFGLLGNAFEMVNRMTCFGILLGHTQLLARIASIIDFRNPQMDGMLERLLQPFVPGRAPPPETKKIDHP